MTQKELFRAVVGPMIIVSTLLGIFVTPWALAFTLFIGVNMFQSAFTNFCPMDNMLRRSGRPGCPEVQQ
jgi:hypothetical protein